MIPGLFALCTASATGACTRDTGAAPASHTERDSAGVRIVESRSPAWKDAEAWRVLDTPAVSIGTVDGAPQYQLAEVRGVVELSDGRVVVANGGSVELRCYGPDGRYLWASGRRGQGPGEYTAIRTMLSYRGDSVLVYDWGPRRVSVVGPSGRFGRSWTPSLPDDSTFSGSISLIGGLVDGSVAIRISPVLRGMSPPTVTRRVTRVFHYSATGDVLGRVGGFPGTESYEGTGTAIGPLPMGRGLHLATGGAVVAVGNDENYEVTELRPNGSISLIMRRDTHVRPVTAADLAAERNRMRDARRVERQELLRGMPAEMLARHVEGEERMYRDMPGPPAFPAYGDLLVDREGYLWVSEYHPRGQADEQGRTWSVFHPDGRWLGDVKLPPRFTLYQATADHVLGVQTDDSGVQFVRIFRIARRSR